jgi:hypothetical protein
MGLKLFTVSYLEVGGMCIAFTVFGLILGLLMQPLQGWEDHPDKEDHKETDRLFKLIQLQTGAEEYEKRLRQEEADKFVKEFLEKTQKWKQKDEK